MDYGTYKGIIVITLREGFLNLLWLGKNVFVCHFTIRFLIV